MNNVLQSAKEHFRTVASGSLKGPIDVPEWNTQVYFRPAVSLQVQSEALKLNQEGKVVEALVATLIARCLDEDGNHIFKKVDKAELLRSVDPDIMLRIIEEINAGSSDFSDKNMGN